MTAGRVAQILNRGLRRTLGFQISRSRTDPQFHLYGRRTRPIDPQYINVGAGYSRHPMWHALENPRDDYKKSENADIACDLTRDDRWPVESGTVDLVYSSHTVEHLNDKFNAAWFAEAFRVLKPGGVVRITCPNIDLYFDAYERKDIDFFRYSTGHRKLLHSLEQALLCAFATPLSAYHSGSETMIEDAEFRELFAANTRYELLDAICDRISDEVVRAYPNEHKTWLTVEKLSRMLSKVGFDAHSSAHGQSRSPLMRDVNYFDFRHPRISLYVEAIKPQET